jgi:hypothetical protein
MWMRPIFLPFQEDKGSDSPRAFAWSPSIDPISLSLASPLSSAVDFAVCRRNVPGREFIRI